MQNNNNIFVLSLMIKLGLCLKCYRLYIKKKIQNTILVLIIIFKYIFVKKINNK